MAAFFGEGIYVGKYTNVLSGSDATSISQDTLRLTALRVAALFSKPPPGYSSYYWSDSSMDSTTHHYRRRQILCLCGYCLQLACTGRYFPMSLLTRRSRYPVYTHRHQCVCFYNVRYLNRSCWRYAATYMWSTGSTASQSIVVTAAGTYYVAADSRLQPHR